LEEEQRFVGSAADRFDGGEALLEIGVLLVICSITLLTKRKGFWFGGMLFGAFGRRPGGDSFFFFASLS